MIIKIIPIGEKIPYSYQIDNRMPLDIGDYRIIAGGVTNRIEDLYKYKLIDMVNGRIVERMVLTNHILDLSNMVTLSYGIFPLYSNMLDSACNKNYQYDGGQANCIYLDYVNYINSILNKVTSPVISIQEFHIESYIKILDIVLEHYQISDSAKRYCHNEKLHLKELFAKYKNVLYKVGVNSTSAMMNLMYHLTDANAFSEEEIEHIAEINQSYFCNLDMFNTFEQIDIFKNNILNPFVLQVIGHSKNGPMLNNGISIVHYIDNTCRILRREDNITYNPVFELDDNVMFSFPMEMRFAFNAIISYLATNGYMPSVVRLHDNRIEVIDQSLRTSHMMENRESPRDILEHIQILSMYNVTNVEIILTNEEDMYITYNYNNVKQKAYVDMFNFTLVNFNTILNCNSIV